MRVFQNTVLADPSGYIQKNRAEQTFFSPQMPLSIWRWLYDVLLVYLMIWNRAMSFFLYDSTKSLFCNNFSITVCHFVAVRKPLMYPVSEWRLLPGTYLNLIYCALIICCKFDNRHFFRLSNPHHPQIIFLWLGVMYLRSYLNWFAVWVFCILHPLPPRLCRNVLILKPFFTFLILLLSWLLKRLKIDLGIAIFFCDPLIFSKIS